MQDQVVSLLAVSAAERWCPHAWVNGAQVVMQSIKVLSTMRGKVSMTFCCVQLFSPTFSLMCSSARNAFQRSGSIGSHAIASVVLDSSHLEN